MVVTKVDSLLDLVLLTQNQNHLILNTQVKKDGLDMLVLKVPEVGVYCRGRVRNEKIIKLPDYWKDLVDVESISVQLQPIGAHQDIIVKRWDDEFIYLQAQGGMPVNCFYHVYAARKDVNPLYVEYQGDSWKDYPDPNFNPETAPDDPNYNDPTYRTKKKYNNNLKKLIYIEENFISPDDCQNNIHSILSINKGTSRG